MPCRSQVVLPPLHPRLLWPLRTRNEVRPRRVVLQHARQLLRVDDGSDGVPANNVPRVRQREGRVRMPAVSVVQIGQVPESDLVEVADVALAARIWRVVRKVNLQPADNSRVDNVLAAF